MVRNWTRNIIGGLSFTSALFIFQACYGPPQDFMPDTLIEGRVRSKTTSLPIEGIKVSLAGIDQYQITDEQGNFTLYSEWLDSYTLSFKDIDAEQNGTYRDLDTIVSSSGESIFLNVKMEEE